MSDIDSNKTVLIAIGIGVIAWYLFKKTKPGNGTKEDSQSQSQNKVLGVFREKENEVKPDQFPENKESEINVNNQNTQTKAPSKKTKLPYTIVTEDII